MKLKMILKAAVSSMIHGHHTPHCYTARRQGFGYDNNGLPPFNRDEYLSQLERTATSEIENIGWTPHYAEKGYDQPRKGVLMADWNCLPRGLDKILERAGYAIEWSGEWTTCADCNGALRTEPDSYRWKPGYKIVDDELLCNKCAAPTLECDHCKEPWTREDGGLKLCQACYDEENPTNEPEE
jgi:hypothetical protein